MSVEISPFRIRFLDIDPAKEKQLVLLCIDCGATFLGGRNYKHRIDLSHGRRGFATSVLSIFPASRSGTYNNPLVSIAHMGLYLRAHPDGEADFFGGPVSAWETYRLLTFEEIERIMSIRQNFWFIASKDIVTLGDEIKFTPESIDIKGTKFKDWKILDDDDGRVDAIIIFGTSWKFERLIKYNPIVFYVCFGNDEGFLRQLRVSIDSLFDTGKFSGRVCLIGDITPHQFARLSKGIEPKISTIEVTACDRLDQIAARLMIPEIVSCDEFQPILYSDCDVVFDGPADAIFTKMLLSERMCAQQEYFSNLARDISVGSELFSADNLAVDGIHGFNAGVMGFPSSVVMKRLFRIVATCMERHARIEGRSALAYYDQPMSNYVSYKLGAFDPVTLTNFARIGYPQTVGEYSGEQRKGFVHFCGVDRLHRHLCMELYYANIGGKLGMLPE
jgi:hypothetical protein